MKVRVDEFTASLQKQKDAKAVSQHIEAKHVQTVQAQDATQKAVIDAAKLLVSFIASHQPEVTVKNPQAPFPESILTPDIDKVVKVLGELLAATKENAPDDTQLAKKLNEVAGLLRSLPSQIKFPEMPEAVEEVTVKNFIDYTAKFDKLAETFSSIKFPTPEVTVAAPKVVVDNSEVAKVVNELKDVIIKAVSGIEMPSYPSFDQKPVIEALRALQKEIHERPIVKPPSVVAVTNPDGSTVGAPKAWGFNDKEDTGTYVYYGFSAADGSWKLMRKVIATGALRYATGASDYATAWTDRATQTYTRYDEAF